MDFIEHAQSSVSKVAISNLIPKAHKKPCYSQFLLPIHTSLVPGRQALQNILDSVSIPTFNGQPQR
ncbi:hypothetical protein JAAARDRAFT_42180 [Jaapia argillacea MUCL 33604]|uniref:Uncharacterized protein n=1 Tax=Jaapia argillacea MUCL 33604 TaxID=933084 RepID=A0A067P8X3_9AGAM|nr:hypothetical protein JAAARDRAFT_42180 [Jaapia argillacea MUCL 33604]